MKTYKKGFDKFVKMLSDGEHFGFSRFSDGAIFILKNKELRFCTEESAL